MNISNNHLQTEFGLDKEHLDFIINAIGHYADIDAAYIFGSRAIGNYKSTSDIDIALKGNLTANTVGSLREFLNNAAPFLYKADILHYESISHPELKKHIDSFGKEIYHR